MELFHDVNYSVNGKYNGYTIIFFHDLNHSAYNYNFTYVNGMKNKPGYFLEYIAKISRLFIYDRPEEMLRFNILRNRKTDLNEYGKILKNTSVINHCKQLRLFLKHHSIKQPYVLLSHGIGSIYALKFANLFKDEIKKLIMIQPYSLTSKNGMALLYNKQTDDNIDKLLSTLTNENITKLDLHPWAIPFFNVKLKIPIHTFFNISTNEKDKVEVTKIKQYSNFLKKNNPSNYKEFYYKDRSKFLNQTNPLGLAYNIKYAIKGKI